MLDTLWKCCRVTLGFLAGMLVAGLAASLLILAYGWLPPMLNDVIHWILVVLLLAVVVFIAWPSESFRKRWLQESWRERLSFIWELPLSAALWLLILPIVFIAYYSFFTAIDTFATLLLEVAPLVWTVSASS